VSLPYIYTPRPGDRVTVRAAPGGRGCGLAVSTDLAAETGIPAADIPAVAAGIALAMHEAAGLPAPVILERPPVVTREAIIVPGARFRVHGNAIQADPLCGSGVQQESFAPAAIRDIAAALAVMADEAESEPDPAEVEELARVIRADLYPPSESIGLRPGESDRTAARAALRWMKDKQQRGGTA
jgi:hypothetical protein